MIKKKIVDKVRIRRIDGGFAFTPHCFLTDGFVGALVPFSHYRAFLHS